jgi:hypothetical protein
LSTQFIFWLWARSIFQLEAGFFVEDEEAEFLLADEEADLFVEDDKAEAWRIWDR